MNFTNSHLNFEDLPTLNPLELKRISKQYFKIVALNRFVFYIILISVVFVLKKIISEDSFQNYFWIGFLALLILFVLDFTVATIAFKKRKYSVREHDIIYSKGLIVYYRTTIPLNRIQHVEISKSWLERYFGLASLKIYTAGDSGGDLKISGLVDNEADSVYAFISKKINADH